MSKFDDAKTCFAENVNDYLPRPSRLAKMEKQDALMWNLSKGLHSLATAIEERFHDLDSRVQHLEQVLQRDR